MPDQTTSTTGTDATVPESDTGPVVTTPEDEEAFVRAAAADDTGEDHPENRPEAGQAATDVPGDGPPVTQAEAAFNREIESDTLDAVGTDRAVAELSDDERAEDDQADQNLPSEAEVGADVADVDTDDIDDAGFDENDVVEPFDPEVLAELRDSGGK